MDDLGDVSGLKKAFAGDAAGFIRVSGDEYGFAVVALWEEEALGVPGPDRGVSAPEVPHDDRGTVSDEVDVPS